jgi:hypothetical protein
MAGFRKSSCLSFKLKPRHRLGIFPLCTATLEQAFATCYLSFFPDTFSPLLGTDFRGTDFRLVALLRRGFRLDWIWCALTIAAIRPGKRRSISVHREVLCISTPLRSPRIKPASRRTLKCCESVDFGISFSVMFKKFEQLREHSDPTISEKMATRIGSLSA